jgi:hypothetical protein
MSIENPIFKHNFAKYHKTNSSQNVLKNLISSQKHKKREKDQQNSFFNHLKHVKT